MIKILHPFEVWYTYSACIEKDIWEENDSFFSTNFLAFHSSRSISSFGNDFTFKFISIEFIYTLFYSCRNKYITFLVHCWIIVPRFFYMRIISYAFSLCLVIIQFVGIQTLWIKYWSVYFSHTYYFTTILSYKFGSPITHITETLYYICLTSYT